jgi:hypothetical protein
MNEKRIKFIKAETGVDVSCLGILDIEKLCQYCINCLALEMPRIAAIEAAKVGMKVTIAT